MAEAAACRLCGRSLARSGGDGRVYCRPCTAKADREVARTLRVECRECGKKFSTRTRVARYCSDACRSDNMRRYNREYMRRYKADPEKRAVIAARARAMHARRRGRTEDGGSRPRAVRGAGSRPRAAAEPKEAACGLCGRSFAPYGGTRHAYCRQCTAKTDREASRTLRVECRECGGMFSTKSRVVRYCSKECGMAGKRRNDLDYSRRSASDPEKAVMNLARTRARNAAKGG